MENFITVEEIKKAAYVTGEASRISELIIKSKNPELNYQAIILLGINKIKHLETIIKTNDPLYNYKCVKHCMRTESLTDEEKKYFIDKHIQIILNSKNEKIIKELKKFLKYNRLQKNKPRGWNNSKKRKKIRM